MTKVLDDCIHWYLNPAAGKPGLNKPDTSYFSPSIVRRVKNFHHTLPNFKPTPLAKLDNLAGYSGIKSIRVKDESYRCGLNAFKVLGASYALSSYLSQRLKLDPPTVTFELLTSGKFKTQITELTCITQRHRRRPAG
jgi:diaminopropionate ammonia-lyase